MTPRIVVLELAQLEAAHLSDLLVQFADLIRASAPEAPLEDPAVARLVPDAYRDDPEAASEFRGLTQADLLDRRRADAETVLASLQQDGVTLRPHELHESSALEAMTVRLDPGQTAAWLRTLTALRLVLAARLGIAQEDDRDPEDPRFGVYDWLGFRLEGLLQAMED